MDSTGRSRAQQLRFWYSVLIAPFLLNDFANIYIHDFKLWLLIDYVFAKSIPLGILFWLVHSRRVSVDELGLKKIGMKRLLFWTFAISVAFLSLNQPIGRLLSRILSDVSIGRLPFDFDSPLWTIHFFFGFFVVAFLEEVIFRGLTYNILRSIGLQVPMVFVCSSVLFGLIHWSFGFAVVVRTAIVGSILMLSVWRTGSVVPAVVAHYLADIVAFS